MVDTALGTSDGKINSAADMATVLDLALEGKGLNVSASGAAVVFDIDKTLYPLAARRSFMQISNVSDNLGPAPDFDILDVDITDPANDLDHYLSGVDTMLQRSSPALPRSVRSRPASTCRRASCGLSWTASTRALAASLMPT